MRGRRCLVPLAAVLVMGHGAADAACPERVGGLELAGGGSRFQVTVDGEHLHLAGWRGVGVVDVSDPTHPSEVASYGPVGEAEQVALSGGHAFVAAGDSGLCVVDVSDPADPVELGCVAVTGHARRVAVEGGVAFVAAGEGGLQVVDVSDPSSPRTVAAIVTSSQVLGVAVSDQVALFTDSDGLHAVDVSDPSHPALGGLAAVTEGLEDVVISGGYAYASSSFWRMPGIHVFDVSSPIDPQGVSFFGVSPTLNLTDLDAANAHVLLVVQYVGLFVLDITYPVSPLEVGRADRPSASGVAAGDGYAYLASEEEGLEIFDLGGCGVPFSSWVEIVAHVPGEFGSEWRSDLVVGNPGSASAAVQMVLSTADGTHVLRRLLPAGGQGVYEDVVGLAGASGKGILEVRSDQALVVAARTYALTDGGTFGQLFEGMDSDEGLGEGESAWLFGLRQEEGVFRTNLSVANTGGTDAEVEISVHSSGGSPLVAYTIEVGPREVVQDLQPLRDRAGEPDVGWAYARATVRAGRGLLLSASVIDSRTNDPTTIRMERLLTKLRGWCGFE